MTSDHNVLVRVLRVFTDEQCRHGNALGVIDGALVGEADRQRIAQELGFSETIFVDRYDTGELRIFTPGGEIPLAGHPLVGAAWLLLRGQESPTVLDLRPPGGVVHSWADEGGERGSTRRSARCLTGPSSSWARRQKSKASPDPFEPTMTSSSTGPGPIPGS